MSNSRKNQFRKLSRWSQWLRNRRQLKRDLRTLGVEQLEDRRLMTATPYTDGKYYPLIGKLTGDYLTGMSAAEYARRANLTNTPNSHSSTGSSAEGLASSQAEGLAGSVLNVLEVENNDLPRTPQLIPLGTIASKYQLINLTGTTSNSANRFDEDYYAVDLRAGDIFDTRLTVSAAGYDLSLNDSNGNLVVTTAQTASGYPAVSPLSTGGDTSFSYVIPRDARYLVRVSGPASSSYNLRLQALRNTYEAEAVGTRQILYVDFDGATIRSDIFGGLPTGTARIDSFTNSVSALGVLPQEANAVMDEIMATIRENFTGSLGSLAANGYYGQSGIAGQFDIDIRDSRTSADPWGLPNVSRLIIGNSTTLSIGLRGIAQSIDVGNFDRLETALIFPSAYTEVLPVPRSATTTLATALGRAIGNTSSHEAGHFFGSYHQDNTDSIITLMDSGGLPIGPSRMGVGVDGIFGTPDDIDIDFGVDSYALDEGFSGTEDTAAVVAFGLSTGTRGGVIAGSTYNDRNRDGSLNSGEEGLSNIVVFADYNSNGLIDLNEPRAGSIPGGSYRLAVTPGTWQIRSVAQTNWALTGSVSRTITVGTDQTVSGINFGQYLPNQTVTGFKWSDTNGNGIRDAGEPGIAGVWIYVDLDGDNRIDIGEPSAITIADGSYSLTPPSSGTYAVREVESPGYIQTYPSNAEREHTVTFTAGTPLRGLDFGNQPARDYGDAPAPYPTTIGANGASAGFDSRLTLGTKIDFESDGQPNATATGDDINGTTDDEDGVAVVRPIVQGDTQNSFRVTVTNDTGAAAYLSAWVDWNQDGDWSDAGEKVLSDVTGLSGQTDLRFVAPASVVLGNTFVRFRLSGKPGVAATGFTDIGEVEDYRIAVTDRLKYAINDVYTVQRSSTNNLLDVQSNDFMRTVTGESATITALTRDDTGFSSATSITTSNGSSVTTDGQSVFFTPLSGFQGLDTFTYTVRTSTGATDTATVTVNTTFQRLNPIAIDDSFDLATSAVAYPLNVLANDLAGQAGALTIESFTQPNISGLGTTAGSITMGTGNLSLRYTPLAGFGGTATFTYTVVDPIGQRSTATVTVHTLDGDRLDDQVEFSFRFTDLAGTPITAVTQGQQFKVQVFVDDIRSPDPEGMTPGVSSAYLDLLYNAGLTRPVAGTVGSNFDFAVDFQPPYTGQTSGSNEFPGLISELGGSALQPIDIADAVPVAVLTFTALNAGIADFIGDPAVKTSQTDINVYHDFNDTIGQVVKVGTEHVRYLRSSLSILPAGIVLPYAVDDGQFSPIPLNSISNSLNVLSNDIIGSNRAPSPSDPTVLIGPGIQITNVGNGLLGTVTWQKNNLNDPYDDRLIYSPNPTSDPNFAAIDQFTYTITDVAGISSTATVTLQIGDQSKNTNAKVQLRLEATDLSGTPVDQVAVGQQFQLRGYVKDLRTGIDNLGVYAAFQDILFDKNLASVNSGPSPLNFAIAFQNGYINAFSGNTRIPGLIDEVGSVQDSNIPLGSDERLQFTITMTANASGVLNFIGDPADVLGNHATLLYDSNFATTQALSNSQIRFVRDSITIGSGAAGEGFTNTQNRFDVNADGAMTAIDALIVINTLNRNGVMKLKSSTASGEGEASTKTYFIDVNGDGYVTALDVLQVINAISTTRKASGEGESSTVVTAKTANAEGEAMIGSDLDSIIDSVATDVSRRKRR